ncbi:1-acyl-sn-glycerol-3-phosphate acyltransferase [Roseomonas sp. SSH11]|uniref:1-acyl-sn-glycerol-3-phosphate acyltransferase n=1 Tax=Pararoseomonas baculiformis TaxID=2820812 RepID=A0ABS4ABC5_9PROT|nr:lysophospholipid acyltransferase family protein [Pararoseomonas baculiformis]MBP0444298.1 1-acyl-sn-glycerol-3-phosphate acyltransferase [Pararoseomonas baculiformis]
MDASIRDPAEALAPPSRLRRRKPLRFRRALPGGRLFDVMGDRPFGGRFRAVRRLVLGTLWTLAAMPVQAVLLLLPGRPKIVFARVYWRVMCFLLGMRIRVVGTRLGAPRTLYLANHSSWLDILVLGATLEAAFVSKAEVGRWPLIGTVARLGRTVFVSRSRGRTGNEAKEMRDRLATGNSLILFPEGTSSDGTRVLPFRSSFLAVADAAELIQPVSVAYDRLGGLPACRRDRPVFAWYGDMSIGPHAWRLCRHAGLRVTILLHDPVEPSAIPNRKALSAAAEATVAEGAAILRQNREPRPLPVRAAVTA